MWIEKLARFGYTAKGIVYIIIGWLAVQTALGQREQTTDSQGALTTIAQQPFGKFFLGLMALGLIGYVIWRLIQAIQDPGPGGNKADDIIRRMGYGISGLIYASLAFSALRLMVGAGRSNSNSQQTWTARVLSQPFGQWLVALLGAIIIGYGFYQFYRAYKAKFRKQMNLQEMSPTEDTLATQTGRFGLTARGIVFIVIGFFIIEAARNFDPSQVRGMDGALQTLAQQPYGPWLLGLVALGLIAYGIHMFVQAQYQRINTELTFLRSKTGSS